MPVKISLLASVLPSERGHVFPSLVPVRVVFYYRDTCPKRNQENELWGLKLSERFKTAWL